ncbi:MAG TPA: response regulator [Opitutus sp.]|nr:response regulator [Opitutus sp.]
MKILHLEDNPRDAVLLEELLSAEYAECTIRLVGGRSDFLAALDREEFDLVISDFNLPSFSGLEALHLVRELKPNTPFIFFSGTIGEERAIEAVRSGAADYVIKDRMQRLPFAVQRVIADAESRRQQKKAEENIRQQAEIIAQAPVGILITDLDDRITYCNAAAAQLYGLPAGKLCGASTAEIFSGETLKRIQLGMSAALATGRWVEELPVSTTTGRTFPVEFHNSPIRDADGRTKACLWMAIDLTEKKKLEQQLLRAQRLENLGMLAAGIAHDLNNVLAPVLLGAPLLRITATNPDDIKVLNTIEASADRGAALVKQIMSFAHGVRGEQVIIQGKHLLRDIRALIEQTFPKSITLVEEVANNLWTIEGSPTHLHQVLLNLCVNARDAMPRGGVLRLRAANQTLDPVEAQSIPGIAPGRYLLLEVSDSGTGIPPEILAQIWEPFFTTKGEGKGTGLGLSTVRGIVASYHGTIDVKSTVGQGTTFRVYLPATADANAGAAIAAARQPQMVGRGELVLIVDDESSIRELAHAILSRHGYRVLTAANGVEAMSACVQHQEEIALVVTDLGMPEMGGNALAKVLTTLKPAQKILFMTGADGHASVGETKPPAGSAVLNKPFVVDEFLAAVRNTIDRAAR